MGGKAVLSTQNEIPCTSINRILQTNSFIAKIDRKTKGELSNLLVEHDVCPICVEKGETRSLTARLGGKVCLECGFFSHVLDFRPPQNDGQHSPPNALSWGNDLGGTLQEKGMFCVLAHTVGTENLPIAMTHLRTIVGTNEHPKIKRMLALGRDIANDCGFSDHSSKESLIVSNYFGKMLRKVGTYFVISNLRISLKSVVHSCFALAMLHLKSVKAQTEIMNKYDVPLDIYETVVEIDRVLRVGANQKNNGNVNKAKRTALDEIVHSALNGGEPSLPFPNCKCGECTNKSLCY